MANAVTDASFEQDVLKNSKPVLVDFWAEWCGPCKMMTPILEEAAKDLTGKVKVVKLNVDDAPDTASKFNVMSIPTFILFKDGKPAAQVVGAMSKDQLIAQLKGKI